MAELKLVVFDVDGTLIDSLAHIKAAMVHAFEAADLDPPSEAAIRSIIGLSLPVAMSHLGPELNETQIATLVDNYKNAFASISDLAMAKQNAPLFSGARAALDRLAVRDDILLGVATGKSRRGLMRMFDLHELHGHFVTMQVADDHPSKPHPSMLHQTLRDTGVEAQNAIMIGDTTFDLEMGQSAGFATLGVEWGYHPSTHLRNYTDTILENFEALDETLDQIWSVRG